jgi:predicted N-acyltransferase
LHDGAIGWNNLVKNNDLFVRHEFLLALEQSGSISAEKGWQSKHLLVFKQQELIAVMPLYLKNHSRGEYVFDQQWADAYYQIIPANSIHFSQTINLLYLHQQAFFLVV